MSTRKSSWDKAHDLADEVRKQLNEARAEPNSVLAGILKEVERVFSLQQFYPPKKEEYSQDPDVIAKEQGVAKDRAQSKRQSDSTTDPTKTQAQRKSAAKKSRSKK